MQESFKKQYLVALCIFWIIVQCVQLDNDWTRMDDDAQYILHAQSIIVNHSYNNPNFVYMQDVDYIPKNAFPGWPLVLVPLFYLFGMNLLVFKMIVILLGLVSGIILFRIVQIRLHDFWSSFLITGIYYFSMTTIVFSKVIYSEWPYILLSFIIIFQSIRRRKKPVKTGALILTGILLGILLLFRFIAIVLLFAVICEMAFSHFRNSKTLYIVKSTVILLIASFVLYQAVVFMVHPEEGPGYKEQFFSKDLYYQEDGQASFVDIVYRIPKNVIAFIEHIPHVIFGRSWYEYVNYRYPVSRSYIDPLIIILGVMITLCMFIGFVKQVINNISVIEYYVLFYLSIMLVIWFHYEVYRYLMPVAIFLVYYMVIGILEIIRKIFRNKKPDKWIVLILSFIFIVNIFHTAMEIYRYKYSPQSEKIKFVSNLSAAGWLKENVKTDEMIIADDPRWYALETGLPVTPSPIFRDIEKVYQHIKQFPGSVIVVDQTRYFQRSCIVPVLQKYHDHFDLLKEFGHIQIYRFVV